MPLTSSCSTWRLETSLTQSWLFRFWSLPTLGVNGHLEKQVVLLTPSSHFFLHLAPWCYWRLLLTSVTSRYVGCTMTVKLSSVRKEQSFCAHWYGAILCSGAWCRFLVGPDTSRKVLVPVVQWTGLQKSKVMCGSPYFWSWAAFCFLFPSLSAVTSRPSGLWES